MPGKGLRELPGSGNPRARSLLSELDWRYLEVPVPRWPFLRGRCGDGISALGLEGCRHGQRVFLGRSLGVRLALRMHLRLLPEGSSPENLAALGEEGGLGRVLQSGSDWDQTTRSSGDILCCYGFLRSLCKMNPSISVGQSCWNNDAEEGISLSLWRTVSLRGIDTDPAQYQEEILV